MTARKPRGGDFAQVARQVVQQATRDRDEVPVKPRKADPPKKGKSA